VHDDLHSLGQQDRLECQLQMLLPGGIYTIATSGRVAEHHLQVGNWLEGAHRLHLNVRVVDCS
jgi:hypothetical protein